MTKDTKKTTATHIVEGKVIQGSFTAETPPPPRPRVQYVATDVKADPQKDEK